MKQRPDHTRSLLALWVIFLFGCMIFTGYRTSVGSAFSSNIMGLIPYTSDADIENKVRKQLITLFERRFVILVKGDSRDHGLDIAKTLQSEFARSELISLNNDNTAIADEIGRFYFPYRYQLYQATLENG